MRGLPGWCCLVLAAQSLHLSESQLPQPCEPPPQLTFRLTQYDHNHSISRKFHAMYDALNQRMAFNEIISGVAPAEQYYGYIFLYGQGIAYEINLTSLKCTKGASGNWTSLGVPKTAIMEDIYTIGGPGDGFQAVEWSNRFYTRNLTWYGQYTMKDCYPVSSILYPSEDRNKSMTSLVYDIVQGLQDPSYFTPPITCMQGTPGQMTRTGLDLMSMVSKTWVE